MDIDVEQLPNDTNALKTMLREVVNEHHRIIDEQQLRRVLMVLESLR